MFMADLCYIFIYIIKWFLKSPVCFRSHAKYDLIFDWSMPSVEQIWQKKFLGIFEKETSSLKAIWPSQITITISVIAFDHETKHW